MKALQSKQVEDDKALEGWRGRSCGHMIPLHNYRCTVQHYVMNMLGGTGLMGMFAACHADHSALVV